jgi:Tfp pilus assembly protein PilF
MRGWRKSARRTGFDGGDPMDKTRREQIEEMLTEDPNDTFLRYGLAMEYVSEGNDVEAALCLGDLLAISPNYVPAYLQGGQALIRIGRGEEAREMLNRGSQVARQQGDQHAYEEMQGFLANL